MSIEKTGETGSISQNEEEPPQYSLRSNTALLAPAAGKRKKAAPEPAPDAAKISRFPHSERSREFRKRHFPAATASDWNNWHWQLQNVIKTPEALGRIISLSPDELAAMTGGTSPALPTAVTPYYASLIDPDDPADPIRRTMIPSTAELAVSPGEAADPLGEDGQSPTPGLVHRYPDRVLFLTTEYCSAYCRYCTRSRLVGHSERKRYSCAQWEKALAYIAATPSIRDVILSGGDPLTLPDESLEWLLLKLRAIKHVEVIRIGTKTPAVLPMRITSALTRILKRCHPLWMSLHFTHPDELTPESGEAAERLADAGCPLGSQTVLLKGINDDGDTMRRLMTGLMKMRVRPYYLYQCDPIVGSAHLRTPVSKGLEIIKSLRGHCSGYAVPHYVIDAPGGGGKIALLPESVTGRDDCGLELRNFQDKTYHYPDF